MINTRKWISIAFMVIGSLFMFGASAANAKTSYGNTVDGEKCGYYKKDKESNKYPQCEGQVKKKGASSKKAIPNPYLSAVLSGISVAHAESSATSQVTVLSYVKAKGLTKAQKRKMSCKYVPAGTGYWNSGVGFNGKRYWFWDTRAGTICTTKSGAQYRAECGNPARSSPPKARIVVGQVKLVKTFGSFSQKVSVTEHVRVQGSCGFAEAKASATARARGYTKVQAKGNAQIEASSKARVQASAKATAMIHCAPTQVITVPPPGGYTCPNGVIVNSPGSCNINTNNAEQDCKAVGGTWNGSQQLCTIIQIIGNCSNIIVVNGSNNVVNNYQEGNCNVTNNPPPPAPPTCPPGNTWNGTICVKDGTTTPPPPATAPGPNPAPSPQDPVGSNQCYSETTGLPVAPRADGLCPAGSYGA